MNPLEDDENEAIIYENNENDNNDVKISSEDELFGQAIKENDVDLEDIAVEPDYNNDQLKAALDAVRDVTTTVSDGGLIGETAGVNASGNSEVAALVVDGVSYDVLDLAKLITDYRDSVNVYESVKEKCQKLKDDKKKLTTSLVTEKKASKNYRAEIKKLKAQRGQLNDKPDVPAFASAGSDNLTGGKKIAATVLGKVIKQDSLVGLLKRCMVLNMPHISVYHNTIKGNNDADKEKIKISMKKFLRSREERKPAAEKPSHIKPSGSKTTTLAIKNSPSGRKRPRNEDSDEEDYSS